MDSIEKDDVPMLTTTNWSTDSYDHNINRRNLQRSRTAVSISIPSSSIEMNPGATNRVGFTGPLRSERKTRDVQRQERELVERVRTKNYSHQSEHLMKSGQLGMCDDPYCTTCPAAYKARSMSRSEGFRHRFDGVWYEGAKLWAKDKLLLIKSFAFGVMNPHAKAVQQWNQFIVISCLFAIFIDPLFFYLLSVKKDCKCIIINWPMTKTIVVFRSVTDLIYFMHILVQFRLAFFSPESRVLGAPELVDHPRKTVLHYLSGYFFLDLFIVLPIPQIIVVFILPNSIASLGTNYEKDLLRAAVLVQYIPRLFRISKLIDGMGASGYIPRSGYSLVISNLQIFVSAGHFVGSCWYLLGLQRVNQCLQDACHNSTIMHCMKFIDCGKGKESWAFDGDQIWNKWKQDKNSSACFTEDGFPYGIYVKAVNLIVDNSMITRCAYSMFWGLQQISTLAGNQTPSYFFWEILFTMFIIGVGLLLFSFLIGSMQNFLQGLGRREMETLVRRRDVEEWMRHENLPENLRRKVRESEYFIGAATQGIDGETLVQNLPEDLQRDVRHHLFKFFKKVRIFAYMDEPLLDAIYERLRKKTYIKGGKVLYIGGVVTKMVFIARGKLESIVENGNKVPLSEGDVCGEELLISYFEHFCVNGGKRLISNRTVKCLSNVEAYVIWAAELEEVTNLFSEYFRNPRVQHAIRNKSLYWRSMAATTIQVAWRHYKKRQNRAKTSRGRTILQPL